MLDVEGLGLEVHSGMEGFHPKWSLTFTTKAFPRKKFKLEVGGLGRRKKEKERAVLSVFLSELHRDIGK